MGSLLEIGGERQSVLRNVSLLFKIKPVCYKSIGYKMEGFAYLRTKPHFFKMRKTEDPGSSELFKGSQSNWE